MTTATQPRKQSDLDRLRDDDGKLPAFAWPGCYPMFYLDKDGAVLCAKCANDPDCDPPAIVYVVHYEGPPEQCESCNVMIESAYGDPEEDK